jgi:UDPglucose 6-dehydrogenase
MGKNGICNLEILNDVLSKLNNDSKAIIVIKSTIIPGSTENFCKIFKNLKIIFNPEFLREKSAIEDFENQNRIILGGSKNITSKVKKIYSNVFPNIPVLETSSSNAEMIKYLTNSFLASKVSFANEIYLLCEKLNLNYKNIIKIACLDERLGKSHWEVPGPDGYFGFDGQCFPKDLSALINLTEKLGSTNDVLKAVETSNIKIKNLNN